MTKKSKEPDKMMDFILNRLDAEDQEMAAMIRPLPASVLPSEQFLDKTRARLLTVMAAPAAGRRAA